MGVRFPRLLSLFSVLLIVSGLLEACGDNPATATPVPTTVAATATTVNTSLITTATAEKPYQGLEINVLTFTGPSIIEPLQRRAPDFTTLTGAKVNFTTVSFDALYPKIMSDLTAKSNNYQLYVLDPQWMVDFAAPGYLEDLTGWIKNDQKLLWNDITPFFRDFSATYNGRTYTVPLDGDFQMVYYRSDLLEKAGLKPPQTWQDYLSIAKTFHNQDLNGDGSPDYGSCIAKKPSAQSYWMFWSIAGSFLQSQGTGQGSFFDTQMKPLTNNPAFATALDIYKETSKYGPTEQLSQDVGDTRTLFTAGRCALALDWGDIGTLALDPQTSKVKDKVGAVILPGSSEVLDRATGKLTACDAKLCPNALDGINHAPYAAFGGWTGGINAAAPNRQKEAAFAFLSFMSQPAQSNIDVTIGKTGFNPYRTSQFKGFELWQKVGMSENAAKLYLGAINSSLTSPNMILDLRVPQAQRYQQVVLDSALSRFLTGELTTKQTMKQIYDGWEQITEELGREKQAAAYSSSLGIKR